MKPGRSLTMLASLTCAFFLLGGGLAVQVGAEDTSFRHVAVFSEVLSLVLDNYVDPVDSERLLKSAYDGLLAGLDAQGAYLTPEEVAEWKGGTEQGKAGPGLSVLRAGRSLQVVALNPGGPAETAKVAVGDQIRAIGGRRVADLSLEQSLRLLQGAPGSTVRLDVLHASAGFTHETVEVQRTIPIARAFSLSTSGSIGVLRLNDLGRVSVEELATELDHAASRGMSGLLVDVRNVVDADPRRVAAVAKLLVPEAKLELVDRKGHVLETLAIEGGKRAFSGQLAILVNGATAGSAEALAGVVRAREAGSVLGEVTYGLGAQVKLYELENGAGLLLPAAQWTTTPGGPWNGEGLKPDEVIEGKGDDYESRFKDQLERAVAFLAAKSEAPERKAA